MRDLRWMGEKAGGPLRLSLVLAGLVVALLGALGLSSSQALPPSSVATSVPPGARIASTENGLRFSAEITSTSISRKQPLAVRLTLANVSRRAIHWSDIHFGWCSDDVPGRIGVAIGFPQGLARPSPLTLGPGESTSVVRATGLGGGTWRIRASYSSPEGEPSGSLPELEVRVRGLYAFADPGSDPVAVVQSYLSFKQQRSPMEAGGLWLDRAASDADRLDRPLDDDAVLFSLDAASERVQRRYGGKYVEVAEVVAEQDRAHPEWQRCYAVVVRRTQARLWRIAEVGPTP